MKKIYFLLFLLVTFIGTVFSQVPASFNYQAVVRNSSGEILANKTVSFRISLLQGSESGAVLYSEKHSLSTNEFGLVNLKIGKGTKLSGDFSPADWGEVIFTKIEIDPAGGSSFSHLATTKLSSVPFAIKAQTVVNDKVDDADADPANELQTLSLNGTLLELSKGGGSVTLPTSGGSGGDNWGTQTIVSDTTLTGEGTTASPLSVIADGDGDDTNELQTLSVSGNDLSISDGNTVALPTAANTSGWTDDDSVVKLSTSTDNVVIGTSTPNSLYKLQVKVTTDIAGKTAIFGHATIGPQPTHNGYGVYGLFESESTGGAGVFGEAIGGGDGVVGTTDAINGSGVFGAHTNGGFAGWFSGMGYFSDRVGIGTATPQAALHVTGNDGVLFEGTFGSDTIPKEGAGTRMMWYPKKAAFRAGHVDGSAWDNANIGNYSVAMGYSTKASGDVSTAMGYTTTASGYSSTAIGYSTKASGNFSIATGYSTTASNISSTAMGYTTTASGHSSTAIGYSTKASGDYSTAIGYSTTASGNISVALGNATIASSRSSTAMGAATTASGGASTAMGYLTTASNENSTAMGNNTIAAGHSSTAMGYATKANGKYTTAMGRSTLADSYLSTTIGQYNVGGGTADSWVDTDPLFEIGNGTDDTHRANAVTVYKNGNAHISGKITSGNANVSLPIAYGVINTAGSVNNATNNVSSVWVSDHYEISISGESYSQTAYVCSIEALGISPVMTTTGASGGKLLVYIYNTLGTQIKDAFHFVVYKLSLVGIKN